MSIIVLKPGAMSSFQDLGRYGSQHLGSPVCGAMDEVSHCLANAVVGNPANTATLEITLIGPALLFNQDALVAWAGADFSPMLDGLLVDAHKPISVKAGQTLQFGKRKKGIRCYLAVYGGYDLVPVLGSCSTYLRGQFGGLEGRTIQKGDNIGLKHSGNDYEPCVLNLGELPSDSDIMNNTGPIRVLAGREYDFFSQTMLEQFVSESWRITPQSDRMGYRISGNSIERLVEREILSVPIPLGTVQVPPDGQPIILMADRQTLGGYPKIATVVAVDIPRLAQLAPGDTLHFEFVGLDVAQTALMDRSVWLNKLFGTQRKNIL